MTLEFITFFNGNYYNTYNNEILEKDGYLIVSDRSSHEK